MLPDTCMGHNEHLLFNVCHTLHPSIFSVCFCFHACTAESTEVSITTIGESAALLNTPAFSIKACDEETLKRPEEPSKPLKYPLPHNTLSCLYKFKYYMCRSCPDFFIFTHFFPCIIHIYDLSMHKK